MTFTRRNFLLCFVSCIAGIIIGLLSDGLFLSSLREKAFEIFLDQMLSAEENEAVYTFKNDSSLVALYAQQRLIFHAGNFKKSGFLKEKDYSRIVGFAEARKAILYERQSEYENTKKHFQIAIELLKTAQINTDIHQLKAILK